jgi:TRAP-type uncharacterized transport system substrate-binding protein
MESASSEGQRGGPYWWLVAALVAAAAAAATWFVLGPSPPRTVIMATGPDGAASEVFGRRYRDLLARHGVDLRLRPTKGAVENLALLQDLKSGVSVAFVQSGLTTSEAAPDLVSLGTVAFEPLWLFCRGDWRRDETSFFEHKRISIGPEGSGTRMLTLTVFSLLSVDITKTMLLDLSPQGAAQALRDGKIDIAGIVSAWESPVVWHLLADENINALSFQRADAYVALLPHLENVTVPRGVADLPNNRPATDLSLIAPKASLIVRSDLHPAIQYLLLDAATRIHSEPGLFHKAGRFPAAEVVDLPLSSEARRFYQSGTPFLQRYLPFWIAVLFERLLVLAIPLLGIVYPLLRLLPSLFAWAMRTRIYRLYGELKVLETELERREGAESSQDLLARLDALEDRANHMRVPITYRHLLYTLRHHIGIVRGSIERLRVPRAAANRVAAGETARPT